MIFLLPAVSFAADINLSLAQGVNGETVTVTVKNLSPVPVTIESIHVELVRFTARKAAEKVQPQSSEPQAPQAPSPGNNGPVFEPSSTPPVGRLIIHADKEESFTFDFKRPNLPGSYPVVSTVRYLNDDKILSLKHASLYHLGEPAPLNVECRAEDAFVQKEGTLTVKSPCPDIWTLILPEEIKTPSYSTRPDKKVFSISSSVEGIRTRYPYFAVAGEISGGVHKAALMRGTLGVGGIGTEARLAAPKKGRMPSNALLALLAAFFFTAAFTREKEGRLPSALAKYSSRMFFLSGAYYLLKNIDLWLEKGLNYSFLKPLFGFMTIAANNFRGANYDYFFAYFADVYFVSCLLLVFPFLYYFDYGKPSVEDKYSSLLRSLTSLPLYPLKRKLFWSKKSKLALLTLCVKLFFVPLLVSWVINNTFHQINISRTLRFDLYTINAYLTALFIYIDTSVFGFGYLFEFRPLKNEIRSVEPTLLGWVVCLWCYPPFNAFSFKVFDYRIIDIAHQYPEWVHALMTCMITALWGVFAWASVALGFKASNLTNRGVIRSGPYRFLRHPAYTAKLLLWYIQGIFFGQFFLGLMLGFTMIYVLRAWTEERHLSADPDYIAYKKTVKWRFIPGVA